MSKTEINLKCIELASAVLAEYRQEPQETSLSHPLRTRLCEIVRQRFDDKLEIMIVETEREIQNLLSYAETRMKALEVDMLSEVLKKPESRKSQSE